MPYSRNNTKKAMSICDAIGTLLDGKERMSQEIEDYVQRASDFMELAFAKMQLEAAQYAAEKVEQLQQLLPIFTVDQGTGEVVMKAGAGDEER